MEMISAVIVTYDSASCVGPCLASLRERLPEAELIVVDNDSRDETSRVVRAEAPRAQLIEIGDNVGFGRASNIGAEAANGSHLLFLNPDAVVTGVDNPRLEELLASHPFGLVAPVLEGEEDRRRAEGSWRAEYFAHTFSILRPREWRPRHRFDNKGGATWVSAAMLLVSRDEFLQLGGFDPRFFLYYEDRDLSRRYQNAGLPIDTTDVIRGRHIGTSSSAGDELRAGPIAWNLLGWIQYVSIHEGERAARRAALSTLVTLRALRLGTQALAATRWPRAGRKARQIDELLHVVSDEARAEETRYCPDALRVIRRLR
jgi:N-acetylglucosaminyl-diphospho-decaprenol L-rhamnosyltransferase